MDAVNLSDYCMGLDETLGAPPSFDDLFKEFCWDDELDKLNVGAKGSVSTPTIGYTATIDPWETMTIDPSKIMKNPSNTVEETSETPSIPSPLTARETSETPSISSPPTPEFSVPMPLPMPVSVASFVDTSQCLGPPQSTSDLNKAYPQMKSFNENRAFSNNKAFSNHKSLKSRKDSSKIGLSNKPSNNDTGSNNHWHKGYRYHKAFSNNTGFDDHWHKSLKYHDREASSNQMGFSNNAINSCKKTHPPIGQSLTCPLQ
ncbi:unnamed protein product [Penicillium manginii]